ncbi:hypothetical protein AB0O75_47100 [Streptomyces sp. NPDC088921]|uniref:hypothetical protein n=1 Tax=unclassified Streptomyces TaxID=2593676 RepID=UPI003438297F
MRGQGSSRTGHSLTVDGATDRAQVGLVFALSEYFGLGHHTSTLAIGVRLVAINGFTVVEVR